MSEEIESERLARLRAEVANFPEYPGVYLMKSSHEVVLYIGKARSLRSRVRSYIGGGDGRVQIPALMSHVDKIEIVVCENENQALILERDLIIAHRPRYNIRLKDDKAYLKVRIDTTHAWPRLETVRRERTDQASYFGPYVSSYQLKEVLDVIKRVIPLRTCSDPVFFNRQRPCLEYQIKRCCGPCCIDVDPLYYRELVDMAVAILEGRADVLLPKLEREMEQAASELKFELAASLRDKIAKLEAWVAGQRNVFHKGVDRHAFGMAREGSKTVVNVLHTRGGRIAESENFKFENVLTSDAEFLGTVIEQYYRDGHLVAPEILVPMEPQELELFEEAVDLLCQQQGLKGAGRLLRPRRGPRLRLLELAQLNAEIHFNSLFRSESQYDRVAKQLKGMFGLGQVPRQIECMDISNLQGSNTVGAIVTFVDGKPLPASYKKYSIGSREGPDDFKSIFEVTKRRLTQDQERGNLPDLLVIDGGKGQLSAACRARDELGVKLDIISIAKIRPGADGVLRPERLFAEDREDPVPLAEGDELTHFMQRLRDEVHRYVISFHRQTRSDAMIQSSLDRVPGIGPARRKRLLRHFGSKEKILAGSVEEISRVGRMSPLIAEKLIRLLQEE